MSVMAVAVKHLIAAGVTGDALVTAIAEMEAAIDTRSTGAKRQARYRERKAGAGVTKRNETSQSVTRYADKEKSPQTPLKEIYPPSPKGDSPPIGFPENPANDIDEPLRPDHVVEAWNETAAQLGLPKVARLTPQRRKRLRTMIAEHPPDDFQAALDAVASSPFCRGENDRGWKADFDFFIQPKSFTKLMEGAYG